MKKYFKLSFLIILSGLILSTPLISRAAVMFSSTESAKVGSKDVFIVHVYFNAEGDNINTVDGTIQISGDAAKVTELSLGGSVLPLWPNKPSLTSSKGSNLISFVGGIPGGLNQGDGLLFNIIFTSVKPGQITIQPQNIVAYKNDGLGTKVPANMKPLVVSVAQSSNEPVDAWRNLIAADNIPPENFSIALGQDPNSFDGKKFITFDTTDGQSGIDHYEVKEGVKDTVRSGSPYILQDQTASSIITVTAYDKAGNQRTISLTPSTGKINWSLIIIWVIILSLIIYGLQKLFRKKKKS